MMRAQQLLQEEPLNPLDVIEHLADRQGWSLERSNDYEVNLIVEGAWADIHLSLNWRDDLESLHLACAFDFRIPPQRLEEARRLIGLINEQLYHGHFDIWQAAGHIVYRNGLMLTGGAIMNDAQCETMIKLGLEACESYYPSLQYVCWAGLPAREALQGALMQTIGQA